MSNEFRGTGNIAIAPTLKTVSVAGEARKIRFSEWFIAIATTAVFGSLARLALSERALTLGTKNGPTHADGLAAVVVGLFLLLAATLPWIRLANGRFAAKFAMVTILAWLAFVAVYFMWWY